MHESECCDCSLGFPSACYKAEIPGFPAESQGRRNHEVQTVNREAGKEGAVETGVKRGLKNAHKP